VGVSIEAVHSLCHTSLPAPIRPQENSPFPATNVCTKNIYEVTQLLVIARKLFHLEKIYEWKSYSERDWLSKWLVTPE